jgi:hypothetical protein
VLLPCKIETKETEIMPLDSIAIKTKRGVESSVLFYNYLVQSLHLKNPRCETMAVMVMVLPVSSTSASVRTKEFGAGLDGLPL